jgi:hypothetical protein
LLLVALLAFVLGFVLGGLLVSVRCRQLVYLLSDETRRRVRAECEVASYQNQGFKDNVRVTDEPLTISRAAGLNIRPPFDWGDDA